LLERHQAGGADLPCAAHTAFVDEVAHIDGGLVGRCGSVLALQLADPARDGPTTGAGQGRDRRVLVEVGEGGTWIDDDHIQGPSVVVGGWEDETPVLRGVSTGVSLSGSAISWVGQPW